jgi:hypothetical protein
MSLYPRLFENPNSIYDPKKNRAIDWDDTNTMPFSYYNEKLLIGERQTTHDDMKYLDDYPEEYYGDGRGQYAGRLFFDFKIVTFWHFPENKEKLKKVLQDLNIKLQEDEVKVDFFDGEWKIEVPSKNFKKLKKYPTRPVNDDYYAIFPVWGDWHPDAKTQKFVTPDEYNKKYERHPEELQIKHLIPPGAGKKEVPYGFGSKSPKYKSKRQWQMATLGDESVHEPFYPSLNEVDSKLYTKGTGNTFLLREVAKKYPAKYKYSTGKRIENIAKTSDDQFVKDFTEVSDEFNLDLDKSSMRLVYPGQPGAVSGKFPGLLYTLDGNKYGVKYSGVSSGGQMTQTPTVFKEGLVVYFFQTEEEYEPFKKIGKEEEKKANYFNTIEKIVKDITDNRIKGMDEKDTDYILRTLTQEGDKYNLLFVNSIFNAMSIGKKLKETNFSDWEIYRDKFFTDIKKEAAKGIGFAANAVDKWNPMDMMLVKPGKKQEILDRWTEAAQKETEQLKLGDYNNIFADDLETENQNILALAISLKEQTAQGGKGKSYISKHETVSDRYNLTKEEQTWTPERFMTEIINQRNKIPTNISKLKEADSFNYRLEGTVEGFSDSTAAKAKYGSLKMLNYLLEKVAEDNMFISLAAYSLSLGQNPAFFKFQGNKDGDPNKVKIHKFPQNGGVSLYNKAYEDYDGKIFIKDGNNNAGLEIKYYIVTAEILYSVVIQIRVNQGTRRTDKSIQVNIEVQRITEIENLAEELQPDNFYPQLNEKFTEKSDPIHDMGIGYDIALQSIEQENQSGSLTHSLTEGQVKTVLVKFNRYANASMIFVPKGDADILDENKMRGLRVMYKNKIYKIPK